MNGPLKRPYKKLYAPSPVGHVVNLDGHREGDPLRPGTVVKVIAHYGPFRRIEDEHGNRMSVGRHSLLPVPKNLDQLKAKADRSAYLYRYWFAVVVYSDGSVAVMNLDDADAALAQRPNLFVVVYIAKPRHTP
jgi:hypothetical protein